MHSRRAAGVLLAVFMAWTLERGTLFIHVDHSAKTDRFVVELPDGELGDTGTTFSVNVAGGRTTRVPVAEGSVVLRLRGQPPLAIGPGGTWTPDARPATADRASPAPSAEPAPSAALAAPLRSAPALAPDRPLDFRAAMAALNAGRNQEAAAAFGSLAKHPRDARAEDAAYLRIIALQRSGDTAAMKDAALAYLRRYPQGFRRAEAEKLSR